MCFLNGVPNLTWTSLDIMDPLHTPEEVWSLGHQETKVVAPAINWE